MGNKSATYSVTELRNPMKILNHKQILSMKNEIANLLIGQLRTIDVENLKISDINNILILLARKLEMPIETIRKKVEQFAVNTNLEIHMTDICNLKCAYCSFKRTTNSLDRDQVIQAIKYFRPKAITFSGGGENTVHAGFGMILNEIEDMFPDIQLGLVTNGYITAKFPAINKLLWVRVSLDASDAQTVEKLKGVNYFDRAIESIEYYLNQTNIPNVGVGFLFSADNIECIPDFLEKMYLIAKRNASGHKLNIQFRPLRPEYDKFWGVIDGIRDDFKLITKDQITNVLFQINRKKEKHGFEKFLENQTNFQVLNADSLSTYWMPQCNFIHCNYSMLYTLLRANGDLYSCIHLGDLDNTSIGNVSFLDHKDGLVYIGLKRLFYSQACHRYCDPHNCRYSYINSLADRKDDPTMEVPKSIQSNYFF